MSRAHTPAGLHYEPAVAASAAALRALVAAAGGLGLDLPAPLAERIVDAAHGGGGGGGGGGNGSSNGLAGGGGGGGGGVGGRLQLSSGALRDLAAAAVAAVRHVDVTLTLETAAAAAAAAGSGGGGGGGVLAAAEQLLERCGLRKGAGLCVTVGVRLARARTSCPGLLTPLPG